MIGKSFTVSTTILLLIATGTTLCWPLPKKICTPPMDLVDTSKPTTVVGTGTAISCTEDALAAALFNGGIITFNCGSQPVSIPITKELNVTKDTDTTIDGGGLVTLDGSGKTRILSFDRGDFRYSTPVLTVQQLRFANAFCNDTNGGCAIFQKKGGTTVVLNCSFENNVGPVVGQDSAGGGIWTIGGGDTTIIGSVFINNTCSNGGALGILGSGLVIYNSHFGNNQATGNGGNPGNGGNGGAISFDGAGRNNTICGTRITQNQGNKFGGAFFRVSYKEIEQNNFDRVLVDGNFITKSGEGKAGGLYIQGGVGSIVNTTIANNAASGAGGIFFAVDKTVTMNGVNLIGNRAYTSLGGAVFCGGESGVWNDLTVANNYAGAFASAFVFCNNAVTLSNSIIANNTVGDAFSPNACNSAMNDGKGVVQSPIHKEKPATDVDNPCTSGATVIDNVAVTLDTTTWKISVTGTQPPVYTGPTVVPGL
jgi:hypothetical protein